MPSFCYIRVENVEDLHRVFVAVMKRTYGKRLVRGTPRITRVNDLTGDRRFNVIDPGDNWLYIGQPLGGADIQRRKGELKRAATRLEKAFVGAKLLAHSKSDPVAAAYLEKALAVDEEVSAPALLQVLVLRADIAVTLEQPDEAKRLLAEAEQLSEDECATLEDIFGQLRELERTPAQDRS